MQEEGYVLNANLRCMEGFPGGSVIKKKKIHLSMQEIQVGSPSWEDPLEKEMATHSSILACEIPWTEEPGRLQSMGSQRVKHDLVTKKQQQRCMEEGHDGHQMQIKEGEEEAA